MFVTTMLTVLKAFDVSVYLPPLIFFNRHACFGVLITLNYVLMIILLFRKKFLAERIQDENPNQGAGNIIDESGESQRLNRRKKTSSINDDDNNGNADSICSKEGLESTIFTGISALQVILLALEGIVLCVTFINDNHALKDCIKISSLARAETFSTYLIILVLEGMYISIYTFSHT